MATNAAKVFLALGDPTRRLIFERVARRPSAVSELAQGLLVTRPAVSQHLKILKDARLVTDEADGARRIYRLDPRGLAEMRAYLNRFWDEALMAFKAAAEEEDDQ